ncbi:hypothetical protein [Vandammella animalimorsus]|uniref:hypothetical protein n=1 Tax=Vandammella animalimorsus TaxID=2029117 RepID=UPI00117D77F8|nr:hypothetical protein [Vandammella animalimorsus]
MKKNVFALSVAVALAGFAGAAVAEVPFIKATVANGAATPATKFEVNSGGIGHILLQPYYTVQGQRNTLMNIINTDEENGKVVKVRYRGARNSDDVFDFYVFLSPGDVWRTRQYRNGEETFLELPDTSCTLPSRNVIAKRAFKLDRVYDGKDQGEVREGYVELLTAANIVENTELYKTIKHKRKTGEVVCDSGVIEDAMEALKSDDQAGADAAKKLGLTFPTAGITGHWAVTEVSTDTTVTGNLLAVVATTKDGVHAQGNLVVAPQNSLNAPLEWRTDGTSDPLLSKGKVIAQNFDFPDLSTPYLSNATTPADQANHLSDGLAVKSIINEFVVNHDVDFRTDWVLSMPTRRYGVAIDYAAGAPVYTDGNTYFGAKNTVFAKVDGVPQVAVTGISPKFYDDNERSLGADVSPGRTAVLAGEVNVITFHANADRSVLGAMISTQRVDPHLDGEKINAGWGRVALKSNDGPNGLPVIGYAALQAGGKALGFTWPHASTR